MRTLAIDMKLRLDPGNIFYYPDVMLVCDASDNEPYFKFSACIIAEVLSRSTELTAAVKNVLLTKSCKACGDMYCWHMTVFTLRSTSARICGIRASQSLDLRTRWLQAAVTSACSYATFTGEWILLLPLKSCIRSTLVLTWWPLTW